MKLYLMMLALFGLFASVGLSTSFISWGECFNVTLNSTIPLQVFNANQSGMTFSNVNELRLSGSPCYASGTEYPLQIISSSAGVGTASVTFTGRDDVGNSSSHVWALYSNHTGVGASSLSSDWFFDDFKTWDNATKWNQNSSTKTTLQAAPGNLGRTVLNLTTSAKSGFTSMIGSISTRQSFTAPFYINYRLGRFIEGFPCNQMRVGVVNGGGGNGTWQVWNENFGHGNGSDEGGSDDLDNANARLEKTWYNAYYNYSTTGYTYNGRYDNYSATGSSAFALNRSGKSHPGTGRFIKFGQENAALTGATILLDYVCVNCNSTKEGVAVTMGEKQTSNGASQNFDQVTPVYELTKTQLNFTISQWLTDITMASANLTYNGANYNASINQVSSTYAILEANVTTPFIITNNTGIQWNFTYVLANGTVNTTATQTQQVIYAYWPNSSSAIPDAVSENTAYSVTTQVLSNSDLASVTETYWVNGTQYVGTRYSWNSSYSNFTRTLTAGMHGGTGMNYTQNIIPQTTVSYNGSSRYVNGSTISITIYALYLSNCSDGISTTQTLAYSAFDEVNGASINNTTFQIIATLISGRNFSFYYVNKSTAYLCIYPATAQTNTSQFTQYGATGYTTRPLYLTNVMINGTVQLVKGGLLSIGNSSLISISVVDQYSNPQPNVKVVFQTFQQNQQAYVDVASVLTGQEGTAALYLQKYSTFYRILLFQNNVLLTTFDPRLIITDSISLSTRTTSDTQYQQYSGIIYLCSYDNSSKIYRCDVSDPSGILTSANLHITQDLMFGNNVLCDISAAGSSITLLCDLSNISTTVSAFNVVLSGSLTYSPFPPVYYPLFYQHVQFPVSSAVANEGLIFAIGIITMGALLGVWNPIASLLFTYGALVVLSVIGILNFAYGPLVGVGVAVGILLNKIKGY